MAYYEFIWTEYALQKIADREISQDDVEYVIQHPVDRTKSLSTGLPLARGYTPTEDWIVCIYRQIVDVLVAPVTAYRPDWE